ncbi:MAG: hypothetical protein A4S09_08050 [Proteobacteria bacterium SG_bin7]|nr:MAG: hypothetical protein A4S09_08050 [Proteobacteria bacterium SG_bin7]
MTSKRIYILGIIFLLSIIYFESAESQTSTKKRRALVIGLDGATGSIVHKRVWKDKKAPTLQELMTLGKNAPCLHDQRDSCARAHSGPIHDTNFYWKTGPGWASVLSGADSLNHRVKNNGHEYLQTFSESTKNYPSFFKRAKDARLKTAAAGVPAFISGNGDKGIEFGVTDYECGLHGNGPNVDINATESCNLDFRKSLDHRDSGRDEKLTRWLIDHINNSSVDILMGVYDRIDEVGHDNGFDGNKKYLNVITETDTLIGRVIRALKSRVRYQNEEWLVITTADHGGHRIILWGDHGRFANQDNAIPFVVTVFGSNVNLADLRYPVTHMDVHPTVMHWFGMSSPQANGKIQGL